MDELDLYEIRLLCALLAVRMLLSSGVRSVQRDRIRG